MWIFLHFQVKAVLYQNLLILSQFKAATVIFLGNVYFFASLELINQGSGDEYFLFFLLSDNTICPEKQNYSRFHASVMICSQMDYFSLFLGRTCHMSGPVFFFAYLGHWNHIFRQRSPNSELVDFIACFICRDHRSGHMDFFAYSGKKNQRKTLVF